MSPCCPHESHRSVGAVRFLELFRLPQLAVGRQKLSPALARTGRFRKTDCVSLHRSCSCHLPRRKLGAGVRPIWGEVSQSQLHRQHLDAAWRYACLFVWPSLPCPAPHQDHGRGTHKARPTYSSLSDTHPETQTKGAAPTTICFVWRTIRVAGTSRRYCRLGISNSTLLRWEARGRFPRRVRLAGTSVAWLLNEIEQWLAERAVERDTWHYADAS